MQLMSNTFILLSLCGPKIIKKVISLQTIIGRIMSQLVSIIIPAYNAARYLPRSVASALAQTYTNIEVVIVDDGSTDETGAVSEQLSQQDNRLRVVHQENLGPAEARHNGFKAATGDFIAYLDADDELLPDAITFLYDKCETNQQDTSMRGWPSVSFSRWFFHGKCR